MFEIGSSLRAARMRQRLELSDVERDTRIRARYLGALEDERFDVLPGPAYTKGFLRTYADYLGLDAQRFLDEYKTRFAAEEELAALMGAGNPVRGLMTALMGGSARGHLMFLLAVSAPPRAGGAALPLAGRQRGRDPCLAPRVGGIAAAGRAAELPAGRSDIHRGAGRDAAS
jgi:hypothetical protein